MAINAPVFIAPLLQHGTFDGRAFVASVAGLAVGASVVVQAIGQPDKVGVIGSITGSIVQVNVIGGDGRGLDISSYTVSKGAQLLQPAQSVTALQSTGVGDVVATGQVSAAGGIKASASRVQGAKGANVASAGTLTLGTDGNFFVITGTTPIDYITTTGWQAGSIIALQFATGASPMLNNNTGTVPGTAAALSLTGGANVNITANDPVMFVYTGTVWAQLTGVVALA